MGSDHIYINNSCLIKKKTTFCTFQAIPNDCLTFPISLSISGLRIWNLRGGEGKIPQHGKLCQTILEK